MLKYILIHKTGFKIYLCSIFFSKIMYIYLSYTYISCKSIYSYISLASVYTAICYTVI